MTVFLHTTHLSDGATDYLVPDTAEGRSFARSTPLRRWFPLLTLKTQAVTTVGVVWAGGSLIGFVTPPFYRIWTGRDISVVFPAWYWWGLNFSVAIVLLAALASILIRVAISRRQRRVDRLHPTVYKVPSTDLDGVLPGLPRAVDGVETLELLWEAGQVDDDVFAATLTRLQQEARRAELDGRHEQWMQRKAREAREHQQRKRQVDELIERHQRDED